MTKAASLVFRDVRFSRGNFDLSVNEDFPAGLLTVILGPSGCGKSTLLDLAAGFLRPLEGRIFEGDYDVTSQPPHKRQVGVVFQEHALFTHMSVRGNVAYGPLVRGARKRDARARADELLALIDLEGFATRRIDSLSGGEKQRVALARALAANPHMLLLDEPFSALDATLRRRLRDEVRQIQRKTGITAILVTHDQEEAMALADRLAVMKDGRVRQFGTPSNLWNNPIDLFTALFLGRSNHLSIHKYFQDESGIRHALTSAGTVPLYGIGNLPELPATLFFRPEYLQCGSKRPDGHVELKARVKSSEYIGGVWRVKLIPTENSGHDELDMDFSEERPPTPSQILSLTLNPAGIRLLSGTTGIVQGPDAASERFSEYPDD